MLPVGHALKEYANHDLADFTELMLESYAAYLESPVKKELSKMSSITCSIGSVEATPTISHLLDDFYDIVIKNWHENWTGTNNNNNTLYANKEINELTEMLGKFIDFLNKQ